MQKLFNKILVPVDFSPQSAIAIQKAVDMATWYECSIHLLHVVSISPLSTLALAESTFPFSYANIDNRKELEFELDKLCSNIKFKTLNSVKAEYSIVRGTWNEVIIDITNEYKYDVILIGQKTRVIGKRKMLLDPDKIAEQTNVPVITAPSNRRLIRLYSIVIPITDFLPVRKLMYGVYIATEYNATVKLLGIKNNTTSKKVYYYLAKSCSIINENCTVKVETELIDGENIADAVNQFALQKSADLIILNPGSQTKMPGWFSSLWGNIIQKYAAPPVLTVSPL